jgi:hypothetical protein
MSNASHEIFLIMAPYPSLGDESGTRCLKVCKGLSRTKDVKESNMFFIMEYGWMVTATLLWISQRAAGNYGWNAATEASAGRFGSLWDDEVSRFKLSSEILAVSVIWDSAYPGRAKKICAVAGCEVVSRTDLLVRHFFLRVQAGIYTVLIHR